MGGESEMSTSPTMRELADDSPKATKDNNSGNESTDAQRDPGADQQPATLPCPAPLSGLPIL